MLYKEKTLIFWIIAKRLNERIGIAIGDLKADTKQEREDEENCHLLLLEKSKCLETQCLDKRFLLTAVSNRT